MPPRKNRGRILFKAEDPEDREISLHEKTWSHISTGHPEPIVNLENIRKTIEDPNVILESESYVNSYAYSNNSFAKSKLYVNVHVGFADAGQTKGDVKTAYVSSSLPKGKVKWIRKIYTT